jgi:hypothetical protein
MSKSKLTNKAMKTDIKDALLSLYESIDKELKPLTELKHKLIGQNDFETPSELYRIELSLADSQNMVLNLLNQLQSEAKPSKKGRYRLK